MTGWHSVKVVVSVDDVDEIAGIMWDLGVSGIEEHDQSEELRELRIGCTEDLTDSVVAALSVRWKPQVESVAADSGLDAWRDHAQVWRIGSIVVVPPWLEVPDDVSADDLVLRIDPGRAFGSASHETTRMCLDVLAERVKPGMTVADIGCGSGVLAIAAARLGATQVVATDISPDAIVATIDNVQRNDVADVIEVTTAAACELQHTSFDLVVANIGASTLQSLASDLVDLLTSSGVLVLSGILADQCDEVEQTFARSGTSNRDLRIIGDWRTLVCERA